jgi:hypothetical protein
MAKLPNMLAEANAGAAKQLTEWEIAGHIGLSVVAGLVVATLYYFTLGRRKRDSAAMPLTLVLLALLVCMVTLIVHESLALAFTLGGTLAIIRFRTVVDDTRDTAFVIASVVVGMGVATGSFAAVFIGLAIFALVVLLAAVVLPNGKTAAHRIIVRIPNDRDPDELTRAAFEILSVKPILLALETAKQGASLEAVYGVKKLDSATILKLLAAFRNIDGVQGVEVKPT